MLYNILDIIECIKNPRKNLEIKQITYNNMMIKDPEIAYICVDSGRVYLGDKLVIDNGQTEDRPRYLLERNNSKDEYQIHVYIKDKLIYIDRFRDVSIAIQALEKYSKAGTNDKIGLSIYESVMDFINGELNLHCFILSMFQILNYDKSVDFQDMIQILNISYKNSSDEEIIKFYKHGVIPTNVKLDINDCIYKNKKYFSMYLSVYYLIHEFSLFKGKNFRDENTINLAPFIQKILNIFK